eukprot:5598875-Prymnesium_polylepis.1
MVVEDCSEVARGARELRSVGGGGYSCDIENKKPAHCTHTIIYRELSRSWRVGMASAVVDNGGWR